MASPEYYLRLVTPADWDTIMTLIRGDFVREETIHCSFVTHHNGLYAQDLYNHLLSYMNKYFREHLLLTNPAIVACEVGTDLIVGFVVLQIDGFPNIEANYLYTSPRKNQRGALAKLNYYHYDIGENAYLYRQFPGAKKHLLLMYLVVQKCHRRKGIATMLLQHSIAYGKEHGFDLVYGIFGSQGSKRTTEKVELVNVFDIDLRAIVDHHSEPAFADMGENNIVSVMALKL